MTNSKYRVHEPSHYERMPDFMDYLTYITEIRDPKTKEIMKNPETGETLYKRCRLTPLEKEIYRVIKRSAGKKNICWKSRENICWEVNCSDASITNAKKVLSMPFEQLGGNSLITIEKRYIYGHTENGLKYKKPNDLITVEHIWDYSFDFFDEFDFDKYLERYPTEQISEKEANVIFEKMRQSIVHNSEPELPRYSGVEPELPRYSASQRPESPRDIIHTTYHQTTYDRSYYPQSRTDDVDKSNMIDVDEGTRAKQFIESKCDEYGVYEGTRKKLIQKYGYAMLYGAIKDLIDLMRRKKIAKPGAYLTKMLEECY